MEYLIYVLIPVLAWMILLAINSFMLFRKIRKRAIVVLMEEGAHLNLDKESMKELIRAATHLAVVEKRRPEAQEKAKQHITYQMHHTYMDLYYLFQLCRKGKHPNKTWCDIADKTNNLELFARLIKANR